MSEAAEVPRDLLEHSAFVRRLARTLQRDGQAAEDIEQETWRAALERPPRGEARSWLARVLRNFARRRWRAETRRAQRERGAARDEALPAADAAPERAETLQRVVDAVRALEEPYRETILLRFYEDLPPRAIAARQGVPVETVHTRLKRGLAELRGRLAREEREGRLALGLLAGESPCLPPHAGSGSTLALPGGVVLTAAAGLLVLWGAWRFVLARPEPRPARGPSATLAAAAPAPGSLASPAAAAGREGVSREAALAGRVMDELGARPVPTGTLDVRVYEGAEHAPIESFRVKHFAHARELPGGGMEYRGVHIFSARDGIARCDHALLEPEGDVHTVELVEPSGASGWSTLGFGDEAPLRQQVRLVAGTTAAVAFVLPEQGVVRGQVVDSRGAPVPGALVFFGEELRLRGDEPFEPLREDRVHDGARTGADGWFELAGYGHRLTVVHAQHSPATVELAESGRIELGPRGSLQGRVRDASGRPAAGMDLWLDEREGLACTTDAGGLFVITGVERGAHALWSGGEWPLACVRLAAGEECELELELAEPRGLALELVPAPEAEDAPAMALLVGRDSLFDVRTAVAGAVRGSLLMDGCPRPGRYWLVTDTGLAASLDLAPDVALVRLELGPAELRVQSAASTSVQLVPADGDPLLRLTSARLRVAIDAGGEACFRAAPGDYVLVGAAGVVLAFVQLPAEGRTFVLP